jgi:hypothetical protein
MIHYHEDNQHAGPKNADGYDMLISGQNLFSENKSEKSIKHFQEDLQSITKTLSTLTTSSARISKRQSPIFGFMSVAFIAVSAMKINNLQASGGDSILRHYTQRQQEQNHRLSKKLLNATINKIYDFGWHSDTSRGQEPLKNPSDLF